MIELTGNDSSIKTRRQLISIGLAVFIQLMAFVKELEKNQIVGFFVLGHHDYWNNGSMSHRDIINLFSGITKDNQYFRFLVTGRKYYFNDICIVGDTGWTSFRRGRRQVEMNQFMCLPDAVQTRI